MDAVSGRLLIVVSGLAASGKTTVGWLLRRMRETYRGPLRLGERIVRLDTSQLLDPDGAVVQVKSAIASV